MSDVKLNIRFWRLATFPIRVSSPLPCFTSVFGMRTGGAMAPSHQNQTFNTKNILKLYKFPNRNQTINTPRLNPLPDLHLEPIKVVICDLSMISNLGAGFSLRCFQRLSHPDIATRRCPWQDSRHTRGRSTLILSYREQSSSKI